MDKINIFIICSTLGYVYRGLESFTQECFDALSKVSFLDITLFKGAGSSFDKNITLWKLKQDQSMTFQINKIIKMATNKGYLEPAEELSFFFSLLPHIYLTKPDVIYFSEYGLGSLLWHWRRWTGQNYKLLYSNGAPTRGEALKKLKYRFDYIQQITSILFQEALNAGIPAKKQSLVPYGLHISSKFLMPTISERKALRQKLKLPKERPIILSVGAIRKYKKMDYVIHELALLPEPRPYLLLLGQQNEESAEIYELANKMLGSDHFQIRTVEFDEISNYYEAADAFVLAALNESFGRVYIEALSHGLPCMAHDYETARFVLGKEGYFGDFTLPGKLAQLIPLALKESHDSSKRYCRYEAAYNRFSWDKLLPDYIELIKNCVGS